MLVLSRKRDESIVLTTPSGDVIEICVVDLTGHKVRLGIEAPKHISVDRQEVYLDKLSNQNQSNAALSPLPQAATA